MSLSAEQIKALLAQPDKSRRTRTKKSNIDSNDRTIPTWFKLAPKAFGPDGDMTEKPQCDNPNCLDERPPIKTSMGELVKIQFTIVLPNGVRTCRRCFMAGYGLDPDETQSTLPVE